MPTGYTAELMERGEPFEKFVLRCARAFGALIEMRDEPMDAPIPDEFKPSDLHAKELINASNEVVRLLGLDELGREEFGLKLKEERLSSHKEWLAKELEENGRLLEMQLEVESWQPPSPDHVKLKNFMLQQIEVSLGNTSYVEDSIATAERASALDYYEEALRSANRDANYHQKEIEKEKERYASRNLWLKQLLESLKAIEAAKR